MAVGTAELIAMSPREVRHTKFWANFFGYYLETWLLLRYHLKFVGGGGRSAVFLTSGGSDAITAGGGGGSGSCAVSENNDGGRGKSFRRTVDQ